MWLTLYSFHNHRQAQIFSALQFVIEEKIMMEFSVSPMKLGKFVVFLSTYLRTLILRSSLA